MHGTVAHWWPVGPHQVVNPHQVATPLQEYETVNNFTQTRNLDMEPKT